MVPTGPHRCSQHAPTRPPGTQNSSSRRTSTTTKATATAAKMNIAKDVTELIGERPGACNAWTWTGPVYARMLAAARASRKPCTKAPRASRCDLAARGACAHHPAPSAAPPPRRQHADGVPQARERGVRWQGGLQAGDHGALLQREGQVRLISWRGRAPRRVAAAGGRAKAHRRAAPGAGGRSSRAPAAAAHRRALRPAKAGAAGELGRGRLGELAARRRGLERPLGRRSGSDRIPPRRPGLRRPALPLPLPLPAA